MTEKNIGKSISIQRNTITNYLGQGYTIGVALIFTPFYLQYLGAEAYGLVGFYMVMQNWFILLDFGFSATLGRQVAHTRGQSTGFDERFVILLKTFELIFIVMTLSIVATVFISSDWVAYNWIKPAVLKPNDIAFCITIMGSIIGLRIFSTIYRSGINGFEDQVWVNKLSIIVNTIKYLGSLLILVYLSNDIRHFFEYQLVIGVLEAVLLGKRFYFNLPSFDHQMPWLKFDWSILKKILPFALSITYTSAVLVVITQFDKLLLSGVLPLEEFGYFSLIAMIAGSVINLSTPVFLAFLPRMTLLASEGKKELVIATYVNMTQIITWVTFTSAMIISIFPREILYSLTGVEKSYLWGHEILVWYTLGSGIYVMGTFQYYLQNAFGKLRLYVLGSTIALIIQTPLIYFVATKYGALATGQLWFGFSAIWFLGWTTVVHYQLLPGFHLNWLIKDLLPMVGSIIIWTFMVEKMNLLDMNDSRIITTTKLIVIGMISMTFTSLSVRTFRSKVFAAIRRKI